VGGSFYRRLQTNQDPKRHAQQRVRRQIARRSDYSHASCNKSSLMTNETPAILEHTEAAPPERGSHQRATLSTLPVDVEEEFVSRVNFTVRDAFILNTGARRPPISASRTRRHLRASGRGESKERATRRIGVCPQPSAARFDDRTADRQPEPQAFSIKSL
jgi:hypothetical protein